MCTCVLVRSLYTWYALPYITSFAHLPCNAVRRAAAMEDDTAMGSRFSIVMCAVSRYSFLADSVQLSSIVRRHRAIAVTLPALSICLRTVMDGVSLPFPAFLEIWSRLPSVAVRQVACRLEAIRLYCHGLPVGGLLSYSWSFFLFRISFQFPWHSLLNIS